MSTGPTSSPQYKPGDVVNGHVLTDQNQWVPAGQDHEHGQQEPYRTPAGTGQVGSTALHGSKPKRPLWKRWWVIALAAVILIAIFANLGGGDDAAEAEPVTIAEPTQEPQSEEDTAAAEAEAAVQAEADAAEAAEKAAEEAAEAAAAAEAVAAKEAEAAAASAAEEAARGSVSQQNAFSKAGDYLRYTAFSRSGLIGQLEFEGFPVEDATFAVSRLEANGGVDWNAQAAAKAADYLEYSSFSRSGLIEQLKFEGFTPEQAEYGVSTTGL